MERVTASRPVPAPDFVGYPEVRRGVRALLEARPGTHLRPVPACREWTVTDLVAHVVEIAERVLGQGGNPLPAPAVPALLDRWDDLGEQLDRRLAAADGRSGEIMVMDAYTHELDLRAALDVPPPAEHLAWAPSFEVLVRGFRRRVGPWPPGAAAAHDRRFGVDGRARPGGRDADGTGARPLPRPGRTAVARAAGGVRVDREPGAVAPGLHLGPVRAARVSRGIAEPAGRARLPTGVDALCELEPAGQRLAGRTRRRGSGTERPRTRGRPGCAVFGLVQAASAAVLVTAVRRTGRVRWPFMMNVGSGGSSSAATARVSAGKRSNSADRPTLATIRAMPAPRQ